MSASQTKSKKLILKKDLVIPAGSVFDEAPTKTVRAGGGNIQHIIGLTKDTSGSVEYCIEDMTSEEFDEWFEAAE